jgi:excisionase family DNA binding protein
MSPSNPDRSDDLLRPREVADLFGVRTTTLARWAREGKLTPFHTPGGHRRYNRQDIRQILSETSQPDEAQRQMEEDAARLYDQGWTIRQVAENFDCTYGVMCRILKQHTMLRARGGISRTISE